MNSKVETYIEKLERWQKESKRLRTIVLGFPLEEELKWGQPCCTLEGKNVAIISGFKDYCALAFFKGALMADPEKILVAPGKVQAGQQIRFTSLNEIVAKESILKAYLAEAIVVEEAGLKVKLKTHGEYPVPEELQRKLNRTPALKRAFMALTPGRQRGYMFFISAPKQAATREAGVEKCVERILAGKGLNEEL